MKPTLTWLDLTADDRDRMRRVLDLFTEQGTIDELGLGTLRDALSDALFPGTSSIQTRLRYLLFIPWLYQRLGRDRVQPRSVADKARQAELALIAPLVASPDNDGVIGAVSKGTLKRLPSAVYWSALNRFGIFSRNQSQSWFHTHFDSLSRPHDQARADDPGVVTYQQPVWHPRLPLAPTEFPGTVSFALTAEEAAFLRDQIIARCNGSLLAWLAAEGGVPSGPFWEEPAVQEAPRKLRTTVELARRFSLHVEGAPLLYNLMLAEQRFDRDAQTSDNDLAKTYRGRLAEWATREQAEAPFDPAQLWSIVATQGARPLSPQRSFVEAWSYQVRATGADVADDPSARSLIRDREIALKAGRSRFTNASRLQDWRGDTGVGRMDFRWFRVRQLLADLHTGLEA